MQSADRRRTRARARAGEVTSFTGLDDPYEPPARPDLVVRPGEQSVEQAAAAIVAAIG